MSIKRNEWLFNNRASDPEQLNFTMLFNKCLSMFKYDGLPVTIPEKDFEIILQGIGTATVTEVNGDLYAFRGNLGGDPNAYYLPSVSVVSNPALSFNKSLKIDDECVVVLNNDMYLATSSICFKYAKLITNAESSLNFNIILSRVPALVQADDDNTFKSAEEFFKTIEEGKKFGVIAGRAFTEQGLKTFDFTSRNNNITDTIEALQYLRGMFYQEIGVKSSYNMKREFVGEAETALNDSTLFPTIDNMMKCRQDGIKKINEKYGTNIKVRFNSSWEILSDEIKEGGGEMIESDRDVDNNGNNTDDK